MAAVAPGSLAAAKSCTPPPTGLVAWWQAQGNANDAAGTNNAGIIGSIGYTNAEVGLGFLFDGASGYISLPACSNLNLGAGSGLTVEGWIQPASGCNAPIVEWDSSYGDGAQFWVEPNLDLYVNLQDLNYKSHQLWTSAGVLSTNHLQHVALTYDRTSGVAAIYLNGVSVASTNMGSFSPQTSCPLNIGRRTGQPIGNGDTFAGILDELSLYNRALSSNEIQSIYLAGSAGKGTNGGAPSIVAQPADQTVLLGTSATFSVAATGSAPLSYQWLKNGAGISNAIGASYCLANVTSNDAGCYSVLVSNLYGVALSSNAVLSAAQVPAGLVSWWSGEGNAKDVAGTNDGVLEGSLSFVPGVVGEAFSLDATNADVRVPASASLDVGAGAGFTVEAWISPVSTARLQPIFEWNDGAGHFGVHFYIALDNGPGTLYANIVDAEGWSHQLVTAGAPVQSNVFQHVALTYDQASGLATIYCDGAVVGQSSLGGIRPLTSYDLYLGRRPPGLDGPFGFIGAIDEARLFGRALSQQEIQAIYNSGKTIPPSIVAPPTNIVVAAGANASFSVVADGDAPLAYQWLKNGIALQDGAGVAGSQSATLTLNNVFASASATYSVLVRNSGGAMMSPSASLSVVFNTTATNIVPKVAISSPVANHWVTNATLLIRGSASTKLALAGVWYRLNEGDWLPAAGLTNWTGTVPLTQTTNILRAVAMDTNGCVSAASSVRFYWAQMVPLRVQIQGQGSVSPASTNRLFQVGKTYTLTASPKAGWHFGAWEGDLAAATPKLTFVMRRGLVLQADFAANPFYALKGAYSGLVCQSGGVDLKSSGQFTLTTTESGAFSGTLLLNGVRRTLSGRFDSDGSAALVFHRTNQAALAVQLSLDVSGGSDTVSGWVGDDTWWAELQGYRAQLGSRTNPVSQAGQYTLMFNGDYSAATQGSGFGFGTVKVDQTGKLTLAGALADGTKISQSAAVARNGSWPLYVPLYGGKGLLLSWMSVENGLSGTANWIKPAQPKASYFPGAFSVQMPAWGARYLAPGKGTNMLSFSSASLMLKADGTAQASEQMVQLGANNQLGFKTVPGSFSLTPATGLFKGTVTDPNTFDTYTVQGVVLQDWNIGCGYFLGRNAAGGIAFGPASQISTNLPDWQP